MVGVLCLSDREEGGTVGLLPILTRGGVGQVPYPSDLVRGQAPSTIHLDRMRACL